MMGGVQHWHNPGKQVLEGTPKVHPEAKAALVRRVLRLVSNTLSEQDRESEHEKLYEQLLRNQQWGKLTWVGWRPARPH